jgi:mRNA-degrading endonuclease toxin of MazEF toxin-antitoxin module
VITPSAENGLRDPCRAMTDKLFAPRRDNLATKIAQLAPEDVAAIERAVAVVLGLGG